MKAKTPEQILDDFPKYQRRKHRGRSTVTVADIRKRQIEWLDKHLKAAYQQGYDDAYDHIRGRYK